ncbi:hypothetical protein L218DRAFT_1077785 [Marasmius fiardii PR-910]|nr:hypothetical protein L218DRAFT_1077785 [Marasmius fiardii PR-910]
MATGMLLTSPVQSDAPKSEFQFHRSYPCHERPPNFRTITSNRIVPRYFLGWNFTAMDILDLDKEEVYERDIDRIIAAGMPAAWKKNGYIDKFSLRHIPRSMPLFDGEHDSFVFFEANVVTYQDLVEGELDAIKHVLNVKTDPEWWRLGRKS